MIEVKNLTKYYGARLAVDHISFTIEKGHVYGFLGPNGAGKSTTMNMITGCLAASDGSVTIDGYDIFEDPVAAKECIGYLPELPPLYTEMTPTEYLTFVGDARRIPKEELAARVSYVEEKTGIAHVANRLIRNLSKGYRQRVGIAQAILGNPEVVILDEPTVGLDPLQIQEIRAIIKELGKEHTVIVSSHILQEISAVCDYVIMINKGKIVAQDTLEHLTSSFGSNHMIKIQAKANDNTVRNILSNVSGLGRFEVNPMGALTEANIFCGAQEDFREALFKAFASAGVPLLELSSDAVSLEDIFLRLVRQSEQSHDDPMNQVKDEKWHSFFSKKKSGADETAETPDDSANKQENEQEDVDYQSLFSTKGDDKE